MPVRLEGLAWFKVAREVDLANEFIEANGDGIPGRVGKAFPDLLVA
jgi:hypothetical protein